MGDINMTIALNNHRSAGVKSHLQTAHWSQNMTLYKDEKPIKLNSISPIVFLKYFEK